MHKLGRVACTWPFAVLLTACGGSKVATTTDGAIENEVAVLAAPGPAITFQPSDQIVRVGETARLSVTATGVAPLTYQWKRNGVAIGEATSATYTSNVVTTGDLPSSYAVVVSDVTGQRVSNYAWVTVGSANAPEADVVTYKNDSGRTGQNLAETILTPAGVSATSFGLLGTVVLDGQVFAQPLFVSHLSIAGTARNVVYLATEHDSVYAVDSDTGATIWQTTLAKSGEVPSDNLGCSFLGSEVGVTATPVIDRSAGAHGVIYVVAMSKEPTTATYHQRLHALDLVSGAELINGPADIVANYPTSDGAGTTFNPAQYLDRSALLLSNGTIYTTWASHCDSPPYTGWILGYSQTMLTQNAVLNVGPNSNGLGPAIWMSGSGPAADSSGNVYLLTANGVFDSSLDSSGFPSKQDFSNSFLKLTVDGGRLYISDYFALWNQVAINAADTDLGSGGAMLLPDMKDSSNVTKHLVVGAGKDGNIYLVDRDSMGKYNSTSNNIWQQVTSAIGGVWGSPAYYNGFVYYGSRDYPIQAFAMSKAKLSVTPSVQTPTTFTYPGTSPTVSANGSTNGILWAYEYTNPGVLHAYDADNIAHELYNSSIVGARDSFGAAVRFQPPVVAGGKVFLGTASGLAVFGYIHPNGVVAQ